MSDILGVVLCGGQSKRMGRDKGLLPIYDIHWATHVASKLETLELPVVASVNLSQVEIYAELFSSEKLIVDNVPAVEGPLQGLLSVHQQYPDHDLLLIACDMIEMDEATLAFLLTASRSEGEAFDFYAFHAGDYIEPFGAVYTAAGLKAVMAKATAGSLPNYSLNHILRNGNTRLLSLVDTNSFRNYNSL